MNMSTQSQTHAAMAQGFVVKRHHAHGHQPDAGKGRQIVFGCRQVHGAPLSHYNAASHGSGLVPGLHQTGLSGFL